MITFDDLRSHGYSESQRRNIDFDQCSRCEAEKTLEWAIHPDYGKLPYSECPSCKEPGRFYYLKPEQVTELEGRK